jgi:iron complex outermembrane recepter protein
VQTPLIVVVGGVTQATVLNGTSASGFGLDFGLTTKPIDPLTLSFNLSVNDLTQDADVRSGGLLVFRKGERLNLSPKYTIGGSAQLRLPMGSSGYKWTTSGSINYTSSRARRLFNITGVTVNDKSLLLASARIGIESPDGWTLSLYGDNLLNEQDPVVGIPAGGVPEQQTRLRPRTIGAQLDFRF